MNSRNCYRINEDDKLMITKMSEEHEQLFRKYIDVSAHYQEIMQLYDIIHFLRREMLDFTAFPVFFVTNLLLVQRKKYYFNRATVSRNCSIVL